MSIQMQYLCEMTQQAMCFFLGAIKISSKELAVTLFTKLKFC